MAALEAVGKPGRVWMGSVGYGLRGRPGASETEALLRIVMTFLFHFHFHFHIHILFLFYLMCPCLLIMSTYDPCLGIYFLRWPSLHLAYVCVALSRTAESVDMKVLIS